MDAAMRDRAKSLHREGKVLREIAAELGCSLTKAYWLCSPAPRPPAKPHKCRGWQCQAPAFGWRETDGLRYCACCGRREKPLTPLGNSPSSA